MSIFQKGFGLGWGSSTKGTPKEAIVKDGETYFYPIGAGASFIHGDVDNKRRLEFFLTVPELNAILNLRARAAGNMRINIVDKETEEVVTGKKDIIAEKLRSPNYFQSKAEFFGQTNLFRDIHGNEYIYAHTPFGTTSISGIFTLPPVNIKVEKAPGGKMAPFFLYDKTPDICKYIYEDKNGNKLEVNKQGLLHLNDNNVNPGTDFQYLVGTSKIDALQAPLENIIAAYEARNVLIVNRGAIGILSNASRDGIGGVAPLDAKEKEKVQNEFRKYGLTKSQWQVIITNLSLNWQQMAIDVDKLRLFEETREDILKICDSYGVPFEMLSAEENTTFSNKREAQVQFYRDTIIPETQARIDGLNKSFFADKDYMLQASFEHLPIFSEELKDRAKSLTLTVTALTKAFNDNAITRDEYRKELKKFGIG